MKFWKTTPTTFTPLLICFLSTATLVCAQVGPWSSRGVRSTSQVIQQLHDHPSPSSSEHPSLSHCDLGKQCALEAAQDVWRMLNPPTSNLFTSETQRDNEAQRNQADLCSIDDDLQHIRAIIRILSDTHNALLEKKLQNLPFIKQVWLRLLHSYKDPLFGFYKSENRPKRNTALSNLAYSGRNFVNFAGRTNVTKQRINHVTKTFANEILISMSALKHAARNAAHGGWLVTPQVKAYVRELTQSFATQSDKWMQRISSLADAAKPITGNIVSMEYIQEVLQDIEDMVVEFRDETWRLRTEWVYKRGETFSWATQSLVDMKRLWKSEIDRISESMRIQGNHAKGILKECLERAWEYGMSLRRRTREYMNRFIGFLVLWIHKGEGLLRVLIKMLKTRVEKSRRVIAFIIVILFFRFMISFLTAGLLGGHAISSVFSRRKVTDSSPIFMESADNIGPGSPRSDVSVGSVQSESRRITEEPSRVTNTAPIVPRPSRVPLTTSPNKDIAVKSATQRQVRRAAARTAKAKPVTEPRPLQVSNFDFQTALSNLDQQNDWQPFRIGDHEVQMVYDDNPKGAPGNNATDLIVKRRSRAARSTGSRRISRREENNLALEQQAPSYDDDNMSASTSGFESATSRQTRSSVRRTSARRSHLR